ncbi:MAG: chloramphenicol acetyltransferase [Bacteroidota bacterium]
MPQQLDISTWHRRDVYHLFKTYDIPFFNVTVNVDVTKAYHYAREFNQSFFLLTLFDSIKVANQIQNFRLRMKGEEVWEYETIDCGSTVLHDDQSFSFAYFKYVDDWAVFQADGLKRIEAQKASQELDPRFDSDELIYYSVLPWLHFTSFQHARRLGREDSIPRIVFGKYQASEGKLLMPVSVEVHHALVDGFHVGQFVQYFQQQLDSHEGDGEMLV